MKNPGAVILSDVEGPAFRRSLTAAESNIELQIEP
jgi:hypothetical protein